MKLKAYILAAATSLGLAAPAAAVSVDLELQLLVDVSGSVSASEFNLQRDGYEAAFRSAPIINAITGGTIGSIAAQLVYWSSSSRQAIGVAWTHISDSTTANAFADAIAAAARPFSGSTSIDAAIRYANPLYDDNGFEGTRLVMDISGDGTSSKSRTEAARDAAEALGITINGLPIGGFSSIENFYTNSVITSDGFVVAASSFDDFGRAVAKKLEIEIGGGPGPVPIPAAGWLLLTGMGGLMAMRRRKKA
ncbi:MAG: DUF1194 domain-containing protein [Jhaorihella sp.]